MKQESKLLKLANELKNCSSRDAKAFRDTASEAWTSLCDQKLGEGNKPSAAMIAALVIHSTVIGQLLHSEEREELMRLAGLALGRYEQRTNPPNKIGNLLAGILKEL
jgi:hypothetical protein